MRWNQQEYDEYMAKRYAGHTREDLADTFQPDEGPESNLQRKAETWLKDHWFPYVHDRSKGKNDPGAILDLHIYLPGGRHVVIEFKAKGNKMSTEQKETFRRIQFLGHEIYECRSFRQFLQIVQGGKS
jgi:hypothetical protein